MLEPMPTSDERATNYDARSILTDEMHSLYMLSFLLTGDLDKARLCLFSGLGECEEEIGVFMEWAQAHARRAILKHAIWMMLPAPERTDAFSVAPPKRSAASGETNLLGVILGLSAFERFVYVMSVLEKHSEDVCSTLLGCSRQDVMIARALVLERLANTYTSYDQLIEAVGAGRTMSPMFCA